MGWKQFLRRLRPTRKINMARRSVERTFRPAVEPLESRELLNGDLIAGTTLYRGGTPSIIFSYQAIKFSGSFTVGVYQSADRTFDAKDVLITSKTVTTNPTNPQAGTINLSSPITSDPNHPYL